MDNTFGEQRARQPKPLAACLSDIHFNVSTLEKATKAVLQAQERALALGVPLFILGDMMDQKAIIRAEVANRLLELFSPKNTPKTTILVGNHSLINERDAGTGKHALNFLRPWSKIIDHPETIKLGNTSVLLMPYQSDLNTMKIYLEDVTDVSLILMHQGVTGTDAGEYYKDPTAIPAEWLAGRRVISGHYHTRQTIPLPDGGTLDYVGNPFTLNFGEAKDPEKGYQILYDDLTLEFVPTNLPAHLTCRLLVGNAESIIPIGTAPRRMPEPGDILRVTIVGPSDELIKLTKAKVQELVNFDNIILDLEPYETASLETSEKLSSQSETLDAIIDGTIEENDRKARLKALWRTFE